MAVYTLQQDAEISRYANQVGNMIVEAGFDPGIMVGMGIGSSADPVGIIIVVKDPNNHPPYGDALVQAFVTIGMPPQLGIDQTMVLDEMKVIVGRKPTP